MWLKLAIGAIIGLIVGHFVAPGYSFWLIIGVLAAFGAEVWATRSRESSIQRDKDEAAQPTTGSDM